MSQHRGTEPRIVWPPEVGCFRIRLVARGWPAPAEIIFDRGLWSALIDGTLAGPPHPDATLAIGVARVWHNAVKITRAEYNWRLAIKVWAAEHQPDHPALHAKRPIDPGMLRPLPPGAASVARAFA